MNARLRLLVCAAMLWPALAGAGGATIPIDDFEQPGRLWWEGPRVPVGEKPVAVVHDPERRSKVLRATLRYTGSPIFISRALHQPIPLWKCKAVSFWYKLSTAKLSSERALICRLRTGPRSFADFIVATSSTIQPGKWMKADIDTRHRKSLVNIYRSFFATAKWMTLRLDGEPGTTVDFEFRVDDIRVEMKEPHDLGYTPHVVARKRPARHKALIIRNSAAALYDLDDIVRSLPFPTDQRVLRFRGLHFPIFGFPASRDELMAHSLLVLVDVDPYVLPLEQVKWICDFVASGGGLLFCGGPNTFGHSKDFKKPLADLLPVAIARANDLAGVNRVPRLAARHAITSGIPARLGKVAKAHLVRPKPGATVLLDIPPTSPPNWGFYTGGGPGGELVATTDAHSGKYAAALIAREFYKDPKTGKPSWLSIAALQGNANGYSGPAAYVAKAATRYTFSFWLKGDLPSVEVQCVGWRSHEAARKHRHYIKTSLAKLRPEAAWRRYEGHFTTAKDTCRFALAFRVHGNPTTLTLGQRIVLDDVTIAEADTGKPVAENGGCEDVASVPILAIGQFHRGRTAVLNACPQRSRTPDGDFFASDFYDDLLRQTLRWLLREEPRIAIERFTPPPRHVMADEPTTAHVALARRQAVGATIACRCLADGRVVGEGKTRVRAADTPGTTIGIVARGPVTSTGRYELRFETHDRRGRVQAVRTCPLVVHPAVEADIRFRYGKLATQAGDRLRFRVVARRWTGDGYVAPEGSLTARARIVDFAGHTVGELAARAMAPADVLPCAELAWRVPDLSKGAYRVEAELLRDGRVVSTATGAFHVVHRLDLATLYPIISVVGGGGGHQPDRALMRERLDDLLAHGFNVAAVGGVTSFREWAEPTHDMAMRCFTEAYAQTNNMALIYEYQSYTNLRRDRPTTPCVHSPDYRRALADYVRPYIEVGAATPRLLSIKVLDEPHAGPKTMDYCDHCRRAWRERFGSELKTPDEIAKDDLVARRQHIEFIRDTVAKGYRIGHELKTQAKAPWDLLLTYCSPAYGRSSDLLRSQEDLLWWAATADRIDFDVYPYFYPVSDKIVFLQAHFCMDLTRNVAQHLRKPWGFYVELDDRNYPLQINPVEASSECAVTAVAHGADYLNTFINRTFGTGTQSRPERWDHLGGTLKQIRAAGPLLNVAHTPPAALAFLFPYAHWQCSRTRWEPYYAHQLLLRAFGECDVVHEEIVRRQGRFACKALALLQTDYLPDDVAKLVADFVRGGGLLLCDRIPKFNAKGEPCALPADLFAKPPPAGDGQLTFARKPFGKGEAILFSSELDAAFAEAVKGEELKGRKRLRDLVRQLLFARGLRPRALADDPEVEIGCRLAKDTLVLTAVNHGRKEAETRVTLFAPPFAIGYLTDSQGRDYKVERTEGGPRFALRLPPRCGVLLFGYPARPARLRLELLTPVVERGGTLRYRVTAVAADGSTCKGQFVARVQVVDPSGAARERYAPGGVTTDGVRELAIPMAVNAPQGAWRIIVSDPFARRRRAARFRVR